MLTNFVDGYNTRVVQRGGGLRLPLEAINVLCRGEPAYEDHLERHEPVQTLLAGPEHHTHAASAQLFEQFVVAECARQRSGVAGQTLDYLAIGEKGVKLRGEVRLPGQELGSVGLHSSFDPRQGLKRNVLLRFMTRDKTSEQRLLRRWVI